VSLRLFLGILCLTSTRLLALAGFNPYESVASFAATVPELPEILMHGDRPEYEDSPQKEGFSGRFLKLWRWSTHPSAEERSSAIQSELKRWEAEVSKLQKA